jgi:hypothetical protein
MCWPDEKQVSLLRRILTVCARRFRAMPTFERLTCWRTSVSYLAICRGHGIRDVKVVYTGLINFGFALLFCVRSKICPLSGSCIEWPGLLPFLVSHVQDISIGVGVLTLGSDFVNTKRSYSPRAAAYKQVSTGYSLVLLYAANNPFSNLYDLLVKLAKQSHRSFLTWYVLSLQPGLSQGTSG